MHEYFYGAQSSTYSFIRVPTVLFTDDQYKYVSAEAKVLYGLLLARMDLSAKNGWLDDQGRVYIICTLSEIMEKLNCADNKATKLMNELEDKCGLIERKRQGLGKPNLIYLERVAFKSEQLRKYFPKSYTPKQMSDVILKLLDQWQKKRQRDKAR